LGYLAVSSSEPGVSRCVDCNGIISEEEDTAVEELQDIVGVYAFDVMHAHGLNAEFCDPAMDREKLSRSLWEALQSFLSEQLEQPKDPREFAKSENYRVFAKWSEIVNDYSDYVRFTNMDANAIRNVINLSKGKLWDAAVEDIVE